MRALSAKILGFCRASRHGGWLPVAPAVAIGSLAPLRSLMAGDGRPDGEMPDSSQQDTPSAAASSGLKPLAAQPVVPRSGGGMQGLHAGYVLAASVLIGLALGYGIDSWLGTLPWGMICGAAFFILAGLYQIVKDFSR